MSETMEGCFNFWWMVTEFCRASFPTADPCIPHWLITFSVKCRYGGAASDGIALFGGGEGSAESVVNNGSGASSQ